MTKQKCLSCDGVFDPDQRGGYYHACPPHRLVKKGPGGPNVLPGDPGPYEDVTKIPQYQVIDDPRDENPDDTNYKYDPEHPDIRAPLKKKGKGVEPAEMI